MFDQYKTTQQTAQQKIDEIWRANKIEEHNSINKKWKLS